MIGDALRSILLADSAVATLVGGARIYPLMIPEHIAEEPGKQPCIVYQATGSERAVDTCTQSRFVLGDFQVDCYASGYDEARALFRAVAAALIDYRGTVSGQRIDRILLESDFDLVDPDPGLFRVSSNFRVQYLEER